MGGVSKWPDTYPDVLHSYLSLAGASCVGNAAPPLQPVYPQLVIPLRAAKRLNEIHNKELVK